MKITRVYSGDDGESHFEDLEIELIDRGDIGRLSKRMNATSILFRENDGAYNLDFHCAPRRQFVINLTGMVELETGDGSTRRLGPGDVLLAEDTTGHGHISRAIGDTPRGSIFVTLD